MKWLIGTACVVIIVSGAVYLNGQYQAYAARQAAIAFRQQAMIAAVNKKADLKAAMQKDLDKYRLAELDKDKCAQVATDVVWVSGMKHMKTADAFTPDQLRDGRLCLTHDLLSHSDIESIKKAGIYTTLVAAN